MTTGLIFDIKRYSINDGPGIRTTLFFKGCPLRCLWCHNPESISFKPQLMHRASRCIHCGRCVQICPQQAISLKDDKIEVTWSQCAACGSCVSVCPSGAMEIMGKLVTVDDMMKEIKKDIIFFDQSGGGVTFSGGEPLAQPVFLKELLRRCNTLDIHTTVDTSCYVDRDVLLSVADSVNLFMCDIKHPDSSKHKACTGVDNAIILDNIRYLTEIQKTVLVRVPVIPGFNDDVKTIESIGMMVKKMKSIKRIDLLPYNMGGKVKSGRLGYEYKLSDIQEPDGRHIQDLAAILKNMGFDVSIGG